LSIETFDNNDYGTFALSTINIKNVLNFKKHQKWSELQGTSRKIGKIKTNGWEDSLLKESRL
jgi:hypothetical protein